MKNSKLIISTLILPIGLIILQGYHFIISKPIVEFVITNFPQLSQSFTMPYPFVASMLNLLIFGTLALIWPKQGFGTEWKPVRRQSVVILGIILLSIAIPIILNALINIKINPFNQMGFVTWTITPIQEEIIFRGFIYSLMLFIFKKTDTSEFKEIIPVIFMSAILFSLWHLSPHAIGKYGWSFVSGQLIVTFILGLLFNFLRYWTKSIWFVIPIHAIGNFVASLL